MMEKFEKILNIFIKNSYTDIVLTERYIANFNKLIKNTFLIMPLLVFLLTALSYPYSVKEFSNINLLIINYVHTFIWLFALILLQIYFILNFFHIKYKVISSLLYAINMIAIMFIMILMLPISGLFFIDNIQANIVYSYYISFILLILFYGFYYHKKWKKFILENHFKKIKKKLEVNDYCTDLEESFFKFDLKEGEKNKPMLARVAEKVIGFMMKFSFTIPVLATISSNGTGGNGAIYFAIYMMLFIIPLIMKLITSPTALFSILKQIEKEENVVIYHGKLKEL